MEQARSYVCKQCSSPVPSGHKFCGACGAPIPPEVEEMRTDYFGAMQAPGRARLVLIRGHEGVEGLSYLLQADEHVAGRQDAQIVFPDDDWLDARHASFVYREDKLFIADADSLNGVYVRIRQPTPIAIGALFICGDEVFRLEGPPEDDAGAAPDNTLFYASPRLPYLFRIVQVLEGGLDGLEFCSAESVAQIGREDSDLNFPQDVYMSGAHARVEQTADGFTLTDCGSRNGTYIRVPGEWELTQGDYVFLGKQLLRVEMSPV